MKNIILQSAIFLFCSCTNTKAINNDQMNDTQWHQYGRTEQVSDPFLHKLQQNNELVLVYAFETYAWAKTVTYNAIALSNNQWTGYNWYVNKSAGAGVEPNVNPSEVSSDSCNALWNFFKEKEVWKIKGDNGENFCDSTDKIGCNINDGAQWRLLIITKDKVIDPSYYEPEYFENCCPGKKDRALFVEAVHKIKSLMGPSR
ncbi:MAG: hypothetical protein ABI921_02600 [Panacibacter sp.]